MSQSSLDEKKKPTLSYWHVWNDEQGISHQTRRELTVFEPLSIDGTIPFWKNAVTDHAKNVAIFVLPVGWVGEWHENPFPQWIVPLSGRWFVESMDGQRVEMGPGELSFGNDQNSIRDAEGRKGHRSGTIGNEPVVLMLTQLLPNVAYSFK